jgi:hypothetical protein
VTRDEALSYEQDCYFDHNPNGDEYAAFRAGFKAGEDFARSMIEASPSGEGGEDGLSGASLPAHGADAPATDTQSDLERDALRYRYLREHHSSHYPMSHEQPAEWTICWDFQQVTPAEAYGSFDSWIDRDIAALDEEDRALLSSEAQPLSPTEGSACKETRDEPVSALPVVGGEGGSGSSCTDLGGEGLWPVASESERKSEDITQYGRCRGCFVHEGEKHLPDCPVMEVNLSALNPDRVMK